MDQFPFGGLSLLFRTSDEEAMKRVRTDDDQDAFALLVRRWERPIQRLCTRMIGDPHRAEDLSQETFARLFARRRHYEPVARFSTFIWRIAINLCHDELRRLQRRDERSLDDEDDEAWTAGGTREASVAPPDVVVEEKERAEMVRKAVLCLPEEYRAVVVLRHYEGLKFREIAEVLGIPEGTVKSRMGRALSRLASQLDLAPNGELSNSRVPKITCIPWRDQRHDPSN